MGATEAKQSPSLYNNYKFLQKKSSPAFGDLTIMQDVRSKQLVAIREQVFQSLKDYEQENTKLSKQAQYQHPNIIQLRQVNSFCEKQFCSSVYKIMHAIEYLPIDLKADIQQRQAPYTEHDLMALLKDVTSAMQFLQSKGITHGDLRMGTIFLQNSSAKKTIYKIAEPSILRVMPAYLSVLTGHDAKGLLFSPKLMDGLRQKAWSPKHNVAKSDVFAFGCILLECALCKSSDDLFDYKEAKIIKPLLEERRAFVQREFSEDFQEILLKMLQLDESKRPDFLELAELLEANDSFSNNVLKPIVNRQLPETLAKDKDVLTEKSNKGQDSYRSLSDPQDKENQAKPNVPLSQKQKILKPLITVIENPEENFLVKRSANTLEETKEEPEDFIEPMRPDEQSNAPICPKFRNSSKSAGSEHQLAEKPNPTQNTLFECPENNFEAQRDNEVAQNEGDNNVFEMPREMETPNEATFKVQQEEAGASIFEYQSGVSFIRPEIQAILNEFKGIKPTEERPTEHKTPEHHPVSIPNNFSKSPCDNLIIPGEISAISDLLPDKYDEPTISHEIPVSNASRILVYETYEDGSVYHGEKLNNLRDGKGKFYYSDGGMYDGDWRCGHIDGFGVLFYPNGCIAYQGEWRVDKFHGKGIVYNETPIYMNEFNWRNFEELGEGWVKYEGDFVEDNKEGEGVLSLVNGEVFVGQFAGDCVQGRGAFYFKDGSRIEGIWVDNLYKD